MSNIPAVDLHVSTDEDHYTITASLVGDISDGDIDAFKSVLRDIRSNNVAEGVVADDNSRPRSASVVVDRAELEFFSDVVRTFIGLNNKFVRWYL